MPAKGPLEEPILNRPSTANPKRPPSPNTGFGKEQQFMIAPNG
jgi:hypothetical protein